MKKLKISLFTAVLAIMTSTAIFTLNSCKQDPCKDETCNDHGTPTEVDKKTCSCECSTGYEGDKCETEQRTKFHKSASSVTEVCGATASSAYYCDVVDGSAINEIKIKNLGNYGCTTGDYYIVATIAANGTDLTISSQSVCSTTFSGSGSYTATNGKITITYAATYNPGTGTVTDNCTATLN